MRYAIINNKSYNLNNYFTENDGRLHLFFNNEVNYNLAQLEDDILESKVIIIGEDDNVIAEFVDYNLLKYMEKRFDGQAQIYVYIDSENVRSIISGIQQTYEEYNERLKTTEYTIRQIESTLNSSVTTLDNVGMMTGDLKQQLDYLERRLEGLENNIDNAFNQINNIIEEIQK